MKPTLAIALITLVAIASTGCVVIQSDSKTRVYGKEVSDEILSRIEIGNTSKDWILATLGEPSHHSRLDESAEILKYTSKSVKTSQAGLLFILNAKSLSEKKQTVFFEFQDGFLTNYWIEDVS
ncbi:MAG: hypothetical protein AAGB46_02100 [Verrucomicrobiota bacterium]